MKWRIFRREAALDSGEVQRIPDSLVREPEANAQDLSPGDQIRVIEGPFENLSGMIKVVDENRGSLNALVNVFGRETPVELHFSQVQKLS